MHTVVPNNIIYFVVKWIHHVFIHISKKIDEIAHTLTYTQTNTHNYTQQPYTSKTLYKNN